ncbi:MAG: glycosyltransferase family 2 protein [Anaerolineae bacterium]
MAQVAVVVLTKNEEAHLRACLESAAWADRLVVFDSYSDDATLDIAAGMGAEILQHPWENYATQRNAALQAVDTPWIFFLDADEQITPPLAGEIRQAVAAGGGTCGYWVPRHNVFWGHRLQGGGWYPDHQLRLLRRGAASYDPAIGVGEVAAVKGPTGVLAGHLIHFNYDSPAEFRTKQRAWYVEYEARVLLERGTRPRPWTYVSMPLREFWRRFVTLGGYRDGWLGAYLCGLMGWYVFLAHWRLRELRAAQQQDWF